MKHDLMILFKEVGKMIAYQPFYDFLMLHIFIPKIICVMEAVIPGVVFHKKMSWGKKVQNALSKLLHAFIQFKSFLGPQIRFIRIEGIFMHTLRGPLKFSWFVRNND